MGRRGRALGIAVLLACSGVGLRARAEGTNANAHANANADANANANANANAKGSWPTVTPKELLPLIAQVARGKPVVVHFWATWCEACAEEFPALQREFEAITARGGTVLLLAADEADKEALAKTQLADWGVGALPSRRLDAPEPDQVAKVLREPKFEGALPATFVFDGKGKKRKAFLGRVTAAALEKAVTSAGLRPAPPKG